MNYAKKNIFKKKVFFKNRFYIIVGLVVLTQLFFISSAMSLSAKALQANDNAPNGKKFSISEAVESLPLVEPIFSELLGTTNEELVPAEEITEEPVAETAEEAPVVEDLPAEVISAPVAREADVDPITSPELTTDKPDYSPGETVSIFGRFFNRLQNIILSIFGGSVEEGNYTEKTDTLKADKEGSFTYLYQLDSIFRPLYTVIASNMKGEELARTTFSDPARPSVKIEQCQNGGIGSTPESCSGTNWVTGNVNGSKAHWQEGDFLPYRAILDNLDTSGQNIVTFSFDTAKSSELTHAIDYLGSFDYTETTGAPSTGHANSNDPCSDIISCTPSSPTATANITVPTDNTSGYPPSCANGTWAGAVIPGAIKAWNVVPASMSVTFPPPVVDSGATDCPTKFIITFTPTSPTVVIAWGGHVAMNAEWGEGNAVPTGSPYHMHAGFPLESPSGTSYNIGNQDLALASSAIVQTASIIIHKDTIPNGPQDFTYTTTGSLDPATFSLDDDADGTLPNTQTYTALAAGSYSVTEGVNADYAVTISCTDPSGGTTVNNSTRTASIDLAAGETVECTFTNTLQTGTIELKKVWVGTGGQTTLNIGTSAGGSEVDTQLTGANGTAPLTTGQNIVNSGTYYVSEIGGLTNYDSALACFNDVNDNGTNDGEPAVTVGAQNSVTVNPNDHVICTFTNTRQQGKIQLTKDFVGTPENVTIKIGTTQNGSQVDSASLSGDGTTSENTVDTGTYYVSETLTTPSNYDVLLECFNDVNDNDAIDGSDTSHSVNTSTGEVLVGNNEDVICRYTNTRQQGSIELKKVWVGTASSVDLNIGTTAGAHDVDQEAGLTTNGTTGANTVDTGTYYVSENLTNASNYNTLLACTKNGESYTPGVSNSVTVGKNDVVVCTFTNTRHQGKIQLVKDFVGTPESVTIKIGTSQGGIEVESKALTADGSTSEHTVDTGTYYVSETLTTPANYDTALECFNDVNDNDAIDGGDTTHSVNTSTGEVSVGDNEDVICRYTNTRHTGTVIVKKVMVGGTDTFNYTGTPSGSISVNEGTIQQTVDTGQYTSTEGAKSGWNLTSIVCDDDNSTGDTGTRTATFNVEKDETIICTFENRKPGAKITLSPMEDTNKVGENHTITATVMVHDGDGIYENAPDGTTVIFSLVNNNNGATFVGGDNDCTTTSGSCSVQINATNTGSVEIHAATDVTVLSVVLHVETDGTGDNSGNASKTYVNARISITPGEDTNPINEAHNFTITVEKNIGAGWVAVEGALVDVAVTPPPDSLNKTDCNDGTAADGICTATINSSVPGVFTAMARSQILVDGVEFKLATNGSGENSGPAVKTYVAGKIIIEKQTLPDGDSQSFEFEPSYDSNFFLTDGQQNDSGWLAPSTYSVSEIVPAGWDLTDIVCDDDDGTNPRSNPVSLQLDADETVTCVFTNTKRGHIIVDKVTYPAEDLQSFDFDASGGSYADFSLTDQDTPNDQELVPGFYGVSETVPLGWDKTSATCVSSLGHAELPGDMYLDPGETITCTFTNTKRGSISGMKFEDKDGNGLFDGLDSGLENWEINLSGAAIATDMTDSNGDYSFDNLVPGTYHVCEAYIAPDWVQTMPSSGYACVNGTNGYTIVLSPGQNSTDNDFGNYYPAEKMGTKYHDLNADGNRDIGEPAIEGWTMFVDYNDDGDLDAEEPSAATDLNGEYQITGIKPGTWKIREQAQTDWFCSEPATTDAYGCYYEETFGSQDVVENNDFGNYQKVKIIVEKQTLPDSSSQSFEFEPSYDSNFFLMDDQQDDSGLMLPGSYSVAEVNIPSDWDLTSATCDNGDDPSAIYLESGDVVTCTFENTQRGHLIIQKTTDPSADPQVFNITASGTGSISGSPNGTITDALDYDYEVTPGTYSVVESPDTGWQETANTCVDVYVAPGATEYCEITNIKRGNIYIIKDAQPNDLKNFEFTGYFGTFYLDDGEGVVGDDIDGDMPNEAYFLLLNAYQDYTVNETQQDYWALKSIACVYRGTSDPYPYVTMGTYGVTIALQPGDSVECTFVNEKLQPTRTQGFWKNHTSFTKHIFDTELGGSFTVGSGGHVVTIDTYGKLFGAFFSSIPKESDGTQRNAVDKARMQLLRQLVTAKLNCASFGCNASTLSLIASADVAYAGTDTSAMLMYAGLLDYYNNSGDTIIPLSMPWPGSATPKDSKAIADLLFWDTP